MKIRRAIVNNRKAQLELTVRSGKVFPIPYAKLDPRPTSKNRIREAYVDKELAGGERQPKQAVEDRRLPFDERLVLQQQRSASEDCNDREGEPMDR